MSVQTTSAPTTPGPAMSSRTITWGIVAVLSAWFIWWQYSNYAHNNKLNSDLGHPKSVPARVAAARELIQKKQFGDVLPTTPKEVHGRVIDALAILSKDPDKDVSKEALTQLVSLMKDPDEAARQKAQQALIQLGATAIPGVVTALADGDAHAKKGAIAVLDKIGAPAIPELVKSVQKEAGQRAAAVDALVALAPLPTNDMLKLLADKDKDVRSAAATYFGNTAALPGRQQIRGEEQLLTLLKDKDVRPAAMRAEGLLKDQRALPEIEKALTDPADLPNRKTAIVALGNMKAIAAVPQIVPFLRSSDPDVQSVTTVALRDMGPEAVGALRQAFTSGDAATRKGVAESLAITRADNETPDPNAISLLTTGLQDKDQGVRQSAATSLGVPNNTAAVSPLIAALQDPSPDVAEAARTSLAQIGTPAVDPLVAVLSTVPSGPVISSGGQPGPEPAGAGQGRAIVARFYASEALGDIIRLKAEAANAVIAAAQSPSAPLSGRAWALVTLKDVHPPSALSALQSIAATGDPSLRWYAQDALRRYQV